MKSMGVIEKTKDGNNKNVFRWIGSSGFSLKRKGENKQSGKEMGKEDKTMLKENDQT